MTELFQNLETLAVRIEPAVAYITLNRPEAKNAMNQQMVRELYAVFTALRDNREVRAIVLAGADGTFCAGGDIKEMRESPVPATESAGNLDDMLRVVNEAPQVVIARIEGAALGGGLGLACVSDIAIASTDAIFGMPEVRLGVVPAFISPFVIQRMGLTRTRELMLTGRRFGGDEAEKYHIAHYVYSPDSLDAGMIHILEMVLQCGPEALAAAKALIFEVKDKSLDDTVVYRANLLNERRESAEAQEGLMAFIQKRPAKWVVQREMSLDRDNST